MGIPERSTGLTACLLRPCILVHLIGTSAYGYDLQHTLSAMGLECDLGNVYRALNAMESEGLLTSTWEMVGSGRSRRRYELTPAGARAVDAYATSVDHLVRVAESFDNMRRDRRRSDPERPLGVRRTGAPATASNDGAAKVPSICTD